MSGFVAADAVEKLDYDFTGAPNVATGEGQCTGKGITPEPTEARLQRFLTFLQDGQKEVLDAIKAAQDGGTPVAPVVHDQLATIRAALADVCAGSPSLEELTQLPPRILLAFYRYMAGELLPKAG